MVAAMAALKTALQGCAVDPLLLGVDREFLETFPKKLVQETGCLPLRRFRGAALVVPPPGTGAEKAVRRLQSASDARLLSVDAIHRYGIELMLRYWESGDGQSVPPIWVPAARRPFLHRLGDVLSATGRIQPAAVIASLLLTSPVASRSPVLVAGVGREANAIFLHGAAGLKVGIRFPAKHLTAVVERLCADFEMPKGGDQVREGKARAEHGLDDLSGLLLPPLKGRSFIIEPRVRR